MAETRTLEREVLEGKVVTELQEIASRLGVSGTQRLKKSDLISAILKATPDGKSADAKSSDVKAPRENSRASAADRARAEAPVSEPAVAEEPSEAPAAIAASTETAVAVADAPAPV